MKISGTKFILITLLIVLIPIYGNWKLLLHGEKTEGVVVKIIEQDAGMLRSFYSIITYQANQKLYTLKGPENVEYEIGKKFPILFSTNDPENSIIFSLRGIYVNRFTSAAVVIFILWMAFYLSFTPKRTNRRSGNPQNNSQETIRRKKLL
ncbi:DUF3592 domain-containing protein [Labilibaculum sp. DW002]|uniref:DUF3592 domain-containing protein n=1 Tax=Paralabilibaculum antarcticum TaxID=2912572 RepID=A0ABT5VLY9_9BACT|nr:MULTISPECIES: DUF3592 domain-containing protein [unclassified Labilibaculum]MBI9059486.1 hypothetical protein [Labilibaculum sp.]MDE5416450.1 DUF3592 domain-containing protein [Labilibaculum sp. DW002]